VANDGVAFRYILPRQKGLNELAITNENSLFCFSDNYTAYVLSLESFSANYENNYRILPIRDIQPETFIGLPLLINAHDKIWIAISEANLTDYSGMVLVRCPESRYALKSILSPVHESPSVKVRGTPPFQTPWRVILIGEKPGDLIESNFIYTLNDSCAVEDPSWIKPGKCMVPWWSDWFLEDSPIKGGMNTATLLNYLDFASDQGWEYLLIDAGWYGSGNHRYEDITAPVSAVDLHKIIAEGKKQHVDILLGLSWECVKDQMDRAFPLYEEWGIAGIKIDSIDREDQEMVRFCRQIMEKAAEHRLLVDFHGSYRPTGIQRTYPNVLTQEAVLGLEWSKWSDRCDPEHELFIPFTRMLAGPMDFTPGCFRTTRKETFSARANPPVVMGTRCHQLAMYVVYESPLQMCVDYPASYQNQPGLTFLNSVPTIWDETRVLDGEVGDFIVVARKRGDTWYIGAMTDWTPRELFIPLDFLGEGRFEAEIFSDKADVIINPTGVLIRRNDQITSTDRLVVPLGPGGGYVARINPLQSVIDNKQQISAQYISK
jgi:alpha-glucosidase